MFSVNKTKQNVLDAAFVIMMIIIIFACWQVCMLLSADFMSSSLATFVCPHHHSELTLCGWPNIKIYIYKKLGTSLHQPLLLCRQMFRKVSRMLSSWFSQTYHGSIKVTLTVGTEVMRQGSRVKAVGSGGKVRWGRPLGWRN